MHILDRPRIICDFETFSELDVRDVGAWRYAEHESTEVLCLSYGPPGQKKKIWIPGMPFPQEVVDHVVAGYPIEAHNCQFERAVWFHQLSVKLGIPSPKCWIDTLASCAYRGLPLGLDDVGEVLDLPIKKSKEGKGLLQKLSKPRKPTKKDPSTRNRDPELLSKLYDYCMQDGEAEDKLGETIGDLPRPEYNVWVMDQRINRRGVRVDLEAVLAALHIVNTITDSLESELRTITENKVGSGSEVAKIGAWCESQGVRLPNLQAGTVEDFLAGKYYELPPQVKRVLEIRQQLSRASAKKLIKFRDCCCLNGRIHGLLQYHGAGTGRWAGRLVQPQNFPRGGLSFAKDEKGREYHGMKGGEFIELLIDTIKTRDADILSFHYGDPMEAIASALRGMFVPSPGKVFYVADFAAIEARVVMWLAGQMDALEAFAKFDRGEGPDIYCVTAGKIYKRPIDKKKDPDERQLGKITVLGCFEPETQVLTDHGPKAILDVSSEDRVWDGVEWVKHAGVVYQGQRKTIHMMGVGVTPEHEVLTKEGWVTATMVAEQNAPERFQALALALESLPSQAPSTCLQEDSNTSLSNVHAVQSPTESGCTTYLKERVQDAAHALNSRAGTGERSSLVMPTSYQMSPTGSGCSIGSPLALEGATTQKTQPSSTMEEEASMSLNLGGTTDVGSCNILLDLKDGISPTLSLTELRLTKDMNPAISGSSQRQSILGTNDKSQKCKKESQSLRHVYDIALAGPRNRFTILTDEGPLIVHNCGYQMSGPKLQMQAQDSYGVTISLEMANLMVTTFRTDYDRVPLLWKGLENGAIRAIRFKRTEKVVSENGVTIYFRYETDAAGNWLTMELPNGRKLWYFEPGLEEREVQYTDKETGELKSFWKDSIYYQGRNNKKGGAWGRVYTYGGMLTENAVQAIARDLMVAAMFRVEKAGFEIVMSVHDEVVAEGEPGKDVHEFEKLVAGPNPEWAKGCPVAAEAWAGKRYRK